MQWTTGEYGFVIDGEFTMTCELHGIVNDKIRDKDQVKFWITHDNHQ